MHILVYNRLGLFWALLFVEFYEEFHHSLSERLQIHSRKGG